MTETRWLAGFTDSQHVEHGSPEAATRRGGPERRWPFGSPGLNKNADHDQDKAGDHFRKHFIDNPRRFVSTENPYRIDQRLAIQKGQFLCPGDVSATFEENLEALGDSSGKAYCLEIYEGAWHELEDTLFRSTSMPRSCSLVSKGWLNLCGPKPGMLIDL